MQEKNAVPAHHGIVGAAASLKRPVVVPDVTLDPRYLMTNPETRSELAVPMLIQDRVIGVLDLESPQLNYFTPDHVKCFRFLRRSSPSRSTTPSFTKKWLATKRAWNAI